MKKLIFALVTVFMMTLFASTAFADGCLGILNVSNDAQVVSIPAGWKLEQTYISNSMYKTTTYYAPETSPSDIFGLWTAANFVAPQGKQFDGFTPNLGTSLGGGGNIYSVKWKDITIDIEKIEMTATEIEEGQDPDDYPINFTSTPEGASTGYDADWYKVAAGTEFTEAAAIEVEGGETFDKAYDYYLKMIFEASGGYAFTNDSVLYVNGSATEATTNEDTMFAIIKVNFKSDEPTTEAPTETTAAPTTTAAATAASTATKTGDTMNPMFYVITIIALAAAATVSIFAARKKK